MPEDASAQDVRPIGVMLDLGGGNVLLSINRYVPAECIPEIMALVADTEEE
jgi:hypothetical protein